MGRWGLWCGLLLVPLVAGAQPAPAPAGATTQIVVPLAVGVSIDFAWTYTTVPTLEGFQLMRCGPLADGTGKCTPETSLGGMIAASQRTGTDTTGTAGARYCWGVRAMGKAGAHSAVSNAYCETLPAVAVVLPAPGDFQKLKAPTP